MVEVDVAIVCACLPTFRPLFDRKVRGNSKTSQVVQSQSMELSPDHTFASKNRGSGHQMIKEKASSNKFLDLVRTDWAEVPSVRNALEWETPGAPFRVGHGIDDHGDRAKSPSLTIRGYQSEHGGDRRKDSDDTLAQPPSTNSVVSSYEGF